MNKQLIKQVARVIGKKLAVHELSIVEHAIGIPSFYNHTRLMNAFAWADTPQGSDFWLDIAGNRWPYNYTRGKS